MEHFYFLFEIRELPVVVKTRPVIINHDQGYLNESISLLSYSLKISENNIILNFWIGHKICSRWSVELLLKRNFISFNAEQRFLYVSGEGEKKNNNNKMKFMLSISFLIELGHVNKFINIFRSIKENEIFLFFC